MHYFFETSDILEDMSSCPDWPLYLPAWLSTNLPKCYLEVFLVPWPKWQHETMTAGAWPTILPQFNHLSGSHSSVRKTPHSFNLKVYTPLTCQLVKQRLRITKNLPPHWGVGKWSLRPLHEHGRGHKDCSQATLLLTSWNLENSLFRSTLTLIPIAFKPAICCRLWFPVQEMIIDPWAPESSWLQSLPECQRLNHSQSLTVPVLPWIFHSCKRLHGRKCLHHVQPLLHFRKSQDRNPALQMTNVSFCCTFATCRLHDEVWIWGTYHETTIINENISSQTGSSHPQKQIVKRWSLGHLHDADVPNADLHPYHDASCSVALTSQARCLQLLMSAEWVGCTKGYQRFYVWGGFTRTADENDLLWYANVYFL